MTRAASLTAGTALLALWAFTAEPARADTLVVCSEASPDALNARSATPIPASTSPSRSPTGWSRWRWAVRRWSRPWPNPGPISPDGLRYTFKLRHGVKFQSSDKFKPTRDMNADDVVFSFDRMLDKCRTRSTGVQRRHLPDVRPTFLDRALKSVSKIDDDTVAFELNAPSASLLSALTVQPFSIWPAEYAAAMQKAGTPEHARPRAARHGPVSVVAVSEGQLDPLPRLPRFLGREGRHAGAGGQGRPARVLHHAARPRCGLPSCAPTSARSRAIRTPPICPPCAPTPGVMVQEAPIARCSACSRSASTRSRSTTSRVRQALAEAIDLDDILKAVFQGSGTPTAAFVPRALWGHDEP